MNKFRQFLTASILVFIMACGSTQDTNDNPTDSPFNSQIETNKKIIQTIYDASASKDISRFVSVLDENIIWNEAESFRYADKNPYIGPNAVLEGVLGRIAEDHDYWNLVDVKLHGMENNMVLATLRYDFKPKNGEPTNIQAAHLWTLKDGKAIQFQQFVDTKKMADAHGG